METNRKTKKSDDALATFIANKAEIDAMLAALKTLSDDHFHVSPEAVNWSHVGSQSHVIERLQEVCRFMGILPAVNQTSGD